jgi:hypothetical protein
MSTLALGAVYLQSYMDLSFDSHTSLALHSSASCSIFAPYLITNFLNALAIE